MHIQVVYEENWRPRVELHPHIKHLRGIAFPHPSLRLFHSVKARVVNRQK